jgi:hypothetical protein
MRDPGVKFKHAAILLVWSAFVTLIVLVLLLPTFGDCFDDQACIRNTNRYFWIVVGPAFIIYWTIFILLIRKWNRDVW